MHLIATARRTDRFVERKIALLDELHRGRGRDRLGHRSDLEHTVIAKVRIAKSDGLFDRPSRDITLFGTVSLHGLGLYLYTVWDCIFPQQSNEVLGAHYARRQATFLDFLQLSELPCATSRPGRSRIRNRSQRDSMPELQRGPSRARRQFVVKYFLLRKAGRVQKVEAGMNN